MGMVKVEPEWVMVMLVAVPPRVTLHVLATQSTASLSAVDRLKEMEFCVAELLPVET